MPKTLPGNIGPLKIHKYGKNSWNLKIVDDNGKHYYIKSVQDRETLEKYRKLAYEKGLISFTDLKDPKKSAEDIKKMIEEISRRPIDVDGAFKEVKDSIIKGALKFQTEIRHPGCVEVTFGRQKMPKQGDFVLVLIGTNSYYYITSDEGHMIDLSSGLILTIEDALEEVDDWTILGEVTFRFRRP
jgi:hypothetical protein